MAHELGISPWEIRYRNAIRPGTDAAERADRAAVHRSCGNARGGEGHLRAEQERRHRLRDEERGRRRGHSRYRAAASWRCKDGKLHIRSGASCIGQGLGTVLTQIVCTMLHCEREDVVYEAANTVNAPDSGTTSGSRQTLVTGEACRRACQKLLAAAGADVRVSDYSGIAQHGRAWNRCPAATAAARCCGHRAARGGAAWTGKRSRDRSSTANTSPRPTRWARRTLPIPSATWPTATPPMCVCSTTTERSREIDAAHFVGKAINPLSCEGQIEGGVTMALGFTLTEHYPLYDCIPSAKVRHAGPVPRRSGAAHPQHSGGEGGAGHGLRRHRHRRDHDHSDGSCRGRARTSRSTARCARSLPLMKTPYERPKMPRYWW